MGSTTPYHLWYGVFCTFYYERKQRQWFYTASNLRLSQLQTIATTSTQIESTQKHPHSINNPLPAQIAKLPLVLFCQRCLALFCIRFIPEESSDETS